eukprot:TRINITY_DN4546_c0_g1_i4.p1 TRINITY_DN4546_c0_g1~~TRINITY_DN4546_c0_g1_i4.p1  ORF type:complete len:666 (+),score=147.56 TRINITY_DN4546_c0_g1_i4:1966-3963(+)
MLSSHNTVLHLARSARDAKMKHCVVRGEHVLVQGTLRPASVHIRDGVIVSIDGLDAPIPEGADVIDARSFYILPGVVDSHVHVNEPGRTEWEGFSTATLAAAAGGVTTIIDMPLNSNPVTTTYEALQIKLNALGSQCCVDVGLLGGVIPGNTNEIAPMVEQGGVVGFKMFMVHSGIDDFPAVAEQDIKDAMAVMKELKKKGNDVVLMFHAEVAEPIDAAAEELKSHDPKSYSTFLKSRPDSAETQAIAIVIRLAKEYGVHVHVVHLSSADAIDMIRAAQKDGVYITVETTYHYLHLQAEQVPDGNTLFKCCPPIREASNQERLWQGLHDDVITLVVSDHSPCVVELKRLNQGDFLGAWGGISSLQLGLPLMWTEAQKRNITIGRLFEWIAAKTSALVHLNDRKGSIEVGKDGDVILFDPSAKWVVDQAKLHFKNKCSPYHGETLTGKVMKTILRGQVIFECASDSDYGTHVGAPSGLRLVPTRTQAGHRYSEPRLPPIERLNAADPDVVKRCVDLLFETAPPLFDPLLKARPFRSYEELIDKATTIVQGLNKDERLQVINAHPRIGLDPNAAAQASTLSRREQGVSDPASDPKIKALFDDLRKYNDLYEQTFGHLFVVFVAGRPKDVILEVLKERLQNEDKAAELNTGLEAMMLIAKDRLKKLHP